MAYSSLGASASQVVSTGFDPLADIRMVLVGRTGNGKSASGNTILNRKAFNSERSPSGVTSHCEKARGVVNGRRVAVIDTPGMYDVRYTEEQVARKLRECISFSAPGPHVFLIVVNVFRFSVEEQKTVDLLGKVFGNAAKKFSMVLFTHGDLLGSMTIETFYRKSPELSNLIQECNQRYHVFNNAVPNAGQVTQLLAKILSMVKHNGGTFYTNAMLQMAERAIQIEMQRIMKEKAEKKHREEKNLRANFKGEALREKLNSLNDKFKSKSRETAEKMNKFVIGGMAVTGAEVGTGIGAAVCTAGGPVCMGVGAVVGGLSGALLGLLAPAAVIAVKNKCTVQ